MENFYLLKGIILGFSVAAPIGPVSILVIRRTLSAGLKFGFLSGLGATTAVTSYSLIAALGLTFVTNFLLGQQFLFRLIGGIFLCYLGVKIFFSKPAEKGASAERKSLFQSYLSVLFLTITNPIAILTFTGMFAGLGLAGEGVNYISGLQVVLGVSVGSAAWWLLLSIGVSLLQNRLNSKVLSWINRISGIIVLIFGLIALYGLI
ncbi:LysE family translocator [Cytobacillus firmus]|uniref:LysE family translocator n=1 Tax=Cytobacillus firmus TaxID=1399 RepID=A0AA46Q6G2_CYTFI|nr:LysE family translocator [Cytobacillus firmus]UYG98174.1 LysE family translocator [Cytobacillus firmus]